MSGSDSFPPRGWQPSRSLVANAADYLLNGINRGNWSEWLPSERNLCGQLQVSRGIIRQALKKLKQDGIIEPHPGRGYRILIHQKKRLRLVRKNSIGILIPGPLNNLTYNTVFTVNSIQTQLIKDGLQVTLHECTKCFKTNGGSMLRKLVSVYQHDCWLLFGASHAIQTWFQDQNLSCFIVGACYPGIELPSISIDYHHLGRHVAGTLISHGHKRIFFLYKIEGSAGALSAVDGFEEECFTHRDKGVIGTVVEFEDHLEIFRQTILRIIKKHSAPTALIFNDPYYSISALTSVLSEGYRVPEDISMICLRGSHFITYTNPPLAHYTLPLPGYTNKLKRLIQKICSEGALRHQRNLVFPTLYPGESIARK